MHGRCARFTRRVFDCFALHQRCTARHTDNHARRGRPFAAVYFADEGFEHFAGDNEIGNDAVFERTDGSDAARRTSQHFFCFRTHRQCFIPSHTVSLHGDYRGFVQNNAFTLYINERIGRTQIDSDVVGEITGEERQHKNS